MSFQAIKLEIYAYQLIQANLDNIQMMDLGKNYKLMVLMVLMVYKCYKNYLKKVVYVLRKVKQEGLIVRQLLKIKRQ